MALILAHFEIDDYDAWKRERFDQDPAGRKQSAKNHVIAASMTAARSLSGVEFG
jgi:hypothetical protein